tara:strand:- start:449 stop:1312 length:864 start_codon:yes stop_codon:yes gene_type:complete
MISFSQLGNMGRLGNQFFQVAATIGAAKKNGLEYCVPKWEVNKYLNSPITEKDYHRAQITHHEKYCTYDPIDFELEADEEIDADLVGYFQSEKYFIKSANLIKQHLQPSEEIVHYIEDKYPTLFDEEDVASLHVRRGDYLSLRHVYTATDLNYYEACLEQCEAKKILVFSDDIKACKDVFEHRDNFFFISERGHSRELISNTHSAEMDSKNYIKEDLVELYLMSKCKYNITTNSSYSWWGAWLNDREDKQVFVPSQWFQHGHLQSICDPNKLETYMDDIVPKSWKRM